MKEIISDERPVRIIPHKRHKGMYRLQWKDGSKSVKYIDPLDNIPDENPVSSYGFYNLTRANDILKHYPEYIADMKLGISMRGNTYRKKAA